ncbi:MAG TPA: Ca2+-dependent phosphoinositide-specific phospholipase C [Rhizomicrobium sp.]|nr:Ca2+-dependent phosphoinositide-specific phospholipase C [Rhizomicrobium sp.]
MRHAFAALFLVPASIFVMAAAGQLSSPMANVAHPSASPAARPCDSRCSPKWIDANLRLDQLQLVATAESTKQRPDKALMALIRMGGKENAEALDFGQAPLTVQLDNDVRGLQFDVAYDPKGGAYKNPAGAGMAMDLLPDDYIHAMAKPGFKVIHVLDVDYRSSCLALQDCLKQVTAWSKAHPRHLPIFITLTINDSKTPMPGATTPQACDETALNALDAEIRATVPADKVITPDQLQGNHASLREAALAHAWPSLEKARGKLIFVLNDAAKAKAYQGQRKSLEGRVMFVATDATDAPLTDAPWAAFVSIPNPVKDGARIRQAVQEGFVVLTRADEQAREARENNGARRAAAFASGAQIIQTDFAMADPAIGPYRVNLADDAGAMCGPELSPEHCVRFTDPQTAPRAVASAVP